MKIDFEKSHGGRQKCTSVKFKKDLTNDCSIRAIVHFLYGQSESAMEYKVIRDGLFEIAKEKFMMPNDDRVVDAFMNKLGFYKKSPKTIDNTKKKYKIGNFPNDEMLCILIRCSQHWTCLYGDVILDTWDCRNLSAQSYYIYETTDEYKKWEKSINWC